MNNHDFKVALINALMNRNVYVQRPSEAEVRTRCPFCGDSRTNQHEGHLYIRINPNDNLPVVYNCFKCPASGILKYDDLEMLGIEGQEFKEGIGVLNKTSDKLPSGGTAVPDKYFQYKIPEPTYCDKIKYVEDRLGYHFSKEELKDIRIITSLKDFLLLNDIHKVTCKPGMARFVEKQYVGFLSSNNAFILFRDITDKEEIRWYKYPITEESKGQRIFYSIKSDIDLYTKNTITINISEGVMDALSICYNLDNNIQDTLNIAICGKFYVKMVKQLIVSGFIGDNIIINIYADNDHTNDTSIEFLRKFLKKYSYMVGQINILYNLKSKDCGVPKENIELQKYKI